MTLSMEALILQKEMSMARDEATLKQLKGIEAELVEARERCRVLQIKRNRLISHAVHEGTRPVDIARVTGLTRARIAQIQRA